MVSAMGTRWKPLSTAAKTSAADGSAAIGVTGLWDTVAAVPPDGPQPEVSKLSKTTIWPTKMLPRGAPRWILLNSGKVMGVVGLRLGNSGLAGNVKKSWGSAWEGAAGTGLRAQVSSGEGLLSRCAGGVWGCLEMTEAELSNLMQHDPIERPRSKTTSSV